MQITFLSLNLLEGGIYWDNIIDLITREKPDILCLQEVFDGDINQPNNFQTIKRLRKLLPHYFFFFSPELFEVWPHGQGDQGNAIFSRFPITEKWTIPLHGSYARIVRPQGKADFSHYPKNLQHAVISIDNHSLHVYNLHGIWELGGEDTPERLNMSDIIVREVKNRKNTLLMGDFNLKPHTTTIRNIETYMKNVFKNQFKTTFNMRHKTNPGYATAVVDMFFVSPDIITLSTSSPDDDVSDHIPLLVKISLT